MKNLAGKTKADLQILNELCEADIKIIEGEKSKGEVPYTLTGRLADWNFSRAWEYWMTHSESREGLPLEVAIELHERKYQIFGEREYKTYGQVVRVNGDCRCPSPTENVRSYHIDSQKGLNALADAIRTLHKITSSRTDLKKILRLHNKISALYNKWETETKEKDVEWLKKMPTILYGNGTIVNELIVVIRDDREVVSLAKKWENNRGGGIAQYFFKGGQITGFNYGHMSGPGQILNRGPEVDGMLRPHYEEVKVLRPNASDSLEKCMRELEKPGPRYKK
jgi:hypothetical protein